MQLTALILKAAIVITPPAPCRKFLGLVFGALETVRFIRLTGGDSFRLYS